MPPPRKIVAVFGISGVGKSTAIQQFMAHHPGWLHLQAGSLIKEALMNVDRDALRLAGIEKIMANQRLMVDKFWEKVKIAPEQTIIFDGHSIIDTDMGLLKIPTDVIQALTPTTLIFLEAAPSLIKERREKDTSRNRPPLDLQTIEVHQQTALQQAHAYSKELSIPIHVVNGDKFKDVII